MPSEGSLYERFDTVFFALGRRLGIRKGKKAKALL